MSIDKNFSAEIFHLQKKFTLYDVVELFLFL